MSRYDFVPTVQMDPSIADRLFRYAFGYTDDGHFVEVGAYDGITYSFTRRLAESGWNGLLIEPEPSNYAACAALYSPDTTEYRFGQRVIVENVACSDAERMLTLYSAGALSTTCPAQVPVLQPNVNVRAVALETLLGAYRWPERYQLLVVDTEGSELDVLRGAGLSRYVPQLIIVELHELMDFPHSDEAEQERAKAVAVHDLLSRAGYKPAYRDAINTAFVLAR